MQTTYQELLKNQLIAKQKKNPGFSLRSFAKQLDMAPSMLSGVLKGEKHLSIEKSLSVAKKLGLDGKDFDYFMALVHFDRASDPTLKGHYLTLIRELSSNQNLTNIEVESFKLLSDWYHFAILELLETTTCPVSPQKMAARLGLSTLQVEGSLSLLSRLGLAEKHSQGAWYKSKGRVRVECKESSKALREFHKQTLELATKSLETQSPQEKFVGSETMVFDPEQLDEANAIIEDCFNRILELANRGKKSEVYHMGIQFFRLTNINKEEV